MKKGLILLFFLAGVGVFYLVSVQFPLPIWFPSEEVQADVIYLGTPEKVVDEMLRLAEVGPRDRLYDLGSGDGRIVITAAQRWGTRGVGIEIDPDLIRLSREKAVAARVAHRVEFVEKDLFKMDFHDASVITLYLMPELNLRLRPIFLNDLRPGTRIVSHRWDMGAWQPDAVRQVTLEKNLFSVQKEKVSTLFSWVIPANVSGTWQWNGSAGTEPPALKIVQHFQKAEGTLFDGDEKRSAMVEVRGNFIRIKSEKLNNGMLVPVVFEGRVYGESIDGTVQYSRSGEADIRPWKVFRKAKTMAALDRP